MMQRLLLLALLSFALSAFADTTLDVTVPGGAGVCSYTTGAVTTGTIAGHLQATATNMSGAGCGSGSNLPVEFGPASQLAPSATTLPGTSGSVGYSFQPLHATQCNASITGGNGNSTASFTGGNSLCTGSACNNLVAKTANFANNSTTVDASYTVSVTCTGDGSPATSSGTVIVPHEPGGGGGGSCSKTVGSSTPGIPNFTQLYGNQTVFYFGSGPGTGYLLVDVGSFASSWQNPWPGSYGIQPVFKLPNAKYLSQAFTVPTPYYSAVNAPSDLYGKFTIGASQREALISMTISTSCGDFSQTGGASTVVSGCYLNKGRAADAITWTKSGSCQLQDGKTYYLNIINADISNVTPTGGTAALVNTSGCAAGTTCSNPFQLQGNFNLYTPQ